MQGVGCLVCKIMTAGGLRVGFLAPPYGLNCAGAAFSP